MADRSDFPAAATVIVIAKEATSSVNVAFAATAAPEAVDLSALGFSEIVSAVGGEMTSLFAAAAGPPDAGVDQGVGTDMNAASGLGLNRFFEIAAPEDALDNLIDQLLNHPDVEAAYLSPPVQPPIWDLTDLPDAPAAPSTPDFMSRQGYLDPAPVGVDAYFAWTCNGGDGIGVQIIDIEGAWQTDHEDLTTNQGGVVAGTPLTGAGWVNHGTAVLGEFSADDNSLGVKGISPNATVRMISHEGASGAKAIKQAADLLNAGDIILIEMHAPGPAAGFKLNPNQSGYIAIEWWQENFVAIRYAANKGIIVVEAGGNGAQDLDDPMYNTPGKGFPANWSNPFARGARDSGAIIVGAGSPPPGTHGRTWANDRARLDFSNYGSAVDVQGWGREVTSTGYGDLQGGAATQVYTDTFSGTSSASPIVTGVVACLQSARKAAGMAALTPDQVRSVLRNTGSAQQDGVYGPATQRIGNRPDLKEALTLVLGAFFNANDGVVTPSDTQVA